MKLRRWFLLFLRYGLSIDAYCARLSNNKAFLADSIQRIAELDRELDTLSIQ